MFRPDAADLGAALKRLCRECGFIGLYPLDGNVPAALAPNEKAVWVFRANVDAIRSADLMMANLNDFRGPGEPDSGTAFEVGFAAALGKPVWGYRSTAEELIERVSAAIHSGSALRLCMNGYLVEDFGLSVNLMLSHAATIIVGGPADCLDAMKAANAGA